MAGYLPRPSRSQEEIDRLTERRARHQDRNHRPHEPRHRPGDWQYSCGLCQEDHALRSCPRFRQLTPYQKYETVERRGYCRNCLARSHLAPDCPNAIGCHKCGRRHHTMLHGAQQLEEHLLSGHNDEQLCRRSTVFIPTAMVQMAEESNGSWASVRALLCPSSVASRIASSTVRRLGLAAYRQGASRFVTVRVKSIHNQRDWVLQVNAIVTNELPRRPYLDPIIEDPTTDFSHDTIADVDPRSNVPIDIELGADVYPSIRRDGVIRTELGRVEAHKTALGYVFIGPTRNH